MEEGGGERLLSTRDRRKRGKQGQTFLWAKLQCIIICVFVLLAGQ